MPRRIKHILSYNTLFKDLVWRIREAPSFETCFQIPVHKYVYNFQIIVEITMTTNKPIML